MLILAAALAAFATGFRRRVRLLSAGAPGGAMGSPWPRLWGMARDAFLHGRVIRDRVPGFLHLMLFIGFVLPLCAVILAASGARLPVFIAGPVSLMLDAAGIAALCAIAWFAWRRYVSKPAHVDRKSEDWVLIALVAGIILSGYCVEGFRFARTGADPLWSPAGFVLGRALAAIFQDSGFLSAASAWTWKFHFASAMLALGLAPYTKLWHAAAVPLNVLLKDGRGPGVFTKPDLEDENAEEFGVSRVLRYSWKDLLDLDSCMRCGRCEAGCPAHLTEKPLSPKKLVQSLRAEWLKKAAAAGEDGKPAEEDTDLIETVVTRDVLWACTNCRYCEEQCPAMIRHVDKISEIRRNLVLMASDFPKELRDTFKNVENNGNPWGVGFSARADWCGPAGVKVLEAGGEADVLYWVGCAGSFDDRNKKISAAMARILGAAGVSFGVMGTDESCCGDPARKTGNEYLFQMQAAQNVENLKARKFRLIMTQCPHCLNMLKREYPQFGGDFEVVSHVEFLDRLIREGKIRLGRFEERFKRICYHDSCFLGRYNGVYLEPRRLLGAAAPSAAMVEADRSKSKSFCCGAGGGRMWLEERIGKRINLDRFDQISAKNPDLVATACPYCLTMMQDAAKDRGKEETVRTLDIAEIVAGLMQ